MDKKRVRGASEEEPVPSDVDSQDGKRLRENLLEGLDDDTEICTSSEDLDSFMRSFQEEIAPTGAVVDLTSDSGEPRPDLGYLLEASDDELGIPPPPPLTSSGRGDDGDLRSELVRVESESSGLGGEILEIPDYDALGFELEGGYGDYVTLERLFDPVIVGSCDLPFRGETLPAQ